MEDSLSGEFTEAGISDIDWFHLTDTVHETSQIDGCLQELFNRWEDGEDFLSSMSDMSQTSDEGGNNTFGDVDGRVADHFKMQRDRRMSVRRSSVAAFGAKLNSTRSEKTNKHILHLLRHFYEQEQYQTMIEEEIDVELPIDFDSMTFAEGMKAVKSLSEENNRLRENLPKLCAENHSNDLENMFRALRQNYEEVKIPSEDFSEVEPTKVSELVKKISDRIANIKYLQTMAREKMGELEILKNIDRY